MKATFVKLVKWFLRFYFRYRHWKKCSLPIVKLTLFCSVRGFVVFLRYYGNVLKKIFRWCREWVYGTPYFLSMVSKLSFLCVERRKMFWLFGLCFVQKKIICRIVIFWFNKILVESICKICWSWGWAWQVVYILILFGGRESVWVWY